MENIIHEINEDYCLVDNLLEQVSKSIFTINKDTDLVEHEIMELSVALENLGLSLNKLNEII